MSAYLTKTYNYVISLLFLFVSFPRAIPVLSSRGDRESAKAPPAKRDRLEKVEEGGREVPILFPNPYFFQIPLPSAQTSHSHNQNSDKIPVLKSIGSFSTVRKRVSREVLVISYHEVPTTSHSCRFCRQEICFSTCEVFLFFQAWSDESSSVLFQQRSN